MQKKQKSSCFYRAAVDFSPIRQDYLEIALKWINNGNICDYMATHQHDPNANELFFYFRAVIDWVENTFVNYRKEMKGLEWGVLYNQFKEQIFDTAGLETEISSLMADDDVSSKKVFTLMYLRGRKNISR